MKRSAAWSLGRRLSLWLAIQTIIGLTLVSIGVYFATASALASRQDEALVQKRALVTHLLEEARRDGDLASLTHKLEDFFAGHPELGLELHRQDGSELYRSAHDESDAERVRTVTFSLSSSNGAVGDVTARVSLNPRADDDLLQRLAATLAAAALLGALAASIGGVLLVRLGLTPLQHLVDQTRDLDADSLGRPLDGSVQPTELQPLIGQINALLERLRRAYQQLEGFNADVAHELNTPLSTIITSTELALRKTRDPEALRDMLGSNLEELHRMSDIIKDMLFLSHAERGGRARRTLVPSLAAIAAEVIDYHDAALVDAELRVEVIGDLAGEFDVPLIKRAISNLLGNATRYAERGSTVRIEIAMAPAGMARLAVVNRGQPIAAEHLPRLFDRFYRADPARNQSDANHGLGLSIVAAIARMHGGEPLAESEDWHTRIGIMLSTGEDRP